MTDPLEPYRRVLEENVRTMAARSRTPLRLLLPNSSRWRRFTVWVRSLPYIIDKR